MPSLPAPHSHKHKALMIVASFGRIEPRLRELPSYGGFGGYPQFHLHSGTQIKPIMGLASADSRWRPSAVEHDHQSYDVRHRRGDEDHRLRSAAWSFLSLRPYLQQCPAELAWVIHSGGRRAHSKGGLDCLLG
jgi:hypothetical protein